MRSTQAKDARYHVALKMIGESGKTSASRSHPAPERCITRVEATSGRITISQKGSCAPLPEEEGKSTLVDHPVFLLFMGYDVKKSRVALFSDKVLKDCIACEKNLREIEAFLGRSFFSFIAFFCRVSVETQLLREKSLSIVVKNPQVLFCLSKLGWHLTNILGAPPEFLLFASTHMGAFESFHARHPKYAFWLLSRLPYFQYSAIILNPNSFGPLTKVAIEAFSKLSEDEFRYMLASPRVERNRVWIADHRVPS